MENPHDRTPRTPRTPRIPHDHRAGDRPHGRRRARRRRRRRTGPSRHPCATGTRRRPAQRPGEPVRAAARGGGRAAAATGIRPFGDGPADAAPRRRREPVRASAVVRTLLRHRHAHPHLRVPGRRGPPRPRGHSDGHGPTPARRDRRLGTSDHATGRAAARRPGLPGHRPTAAAPGPDTDHGVRARPRIRRGRRVRPDLLRPPAIPTRATSTGTGRTSPICSAWTRASTGTCSTTPTPSTSGACWTRGRQCPTRTHAC